MNRKVEGAVTAILLVAMAAGGVLSCTPAAACSRVFVNGNKIAKIVVRSMDLPAHHAERPKLVAFPRGVERDCARSVLPGIEGTAEGLGKQPLRWTSKHGTVVMTAFDGGVSDGINEHGLAAHLLSLVAVGHEPQDDRPELSDALWVQYVLDNFKTVNEVVQAHRAGKFRLVAVTASALGHKVSLGSHLAVEDSTGDSAIIEYVGGKLAIHHGPQYSVMTNDPPLEEMLRRMKKYRAFGGTEALPGDSLDGESRFARLAAHQKLLPEPKNYTAAVAAAFSLIRIAQIPFRDPEKDKAHGLAAIWCGCQTNWIAAADLTYKVYYINSSVVPSLGWVELKDLDFTAGAPVLFLDPHDPTLGGDLAKRFRKWPAPRK